MSDLEITTAVACFALVLSLFGFFIGSIYNSKQIEKLNKRIDREVREVNRQLGLLNNSVYGNLEHNCQGSIGRRLAEVELAMDKHSDLINHYKDIINMQSHQIANLQAKVNDYGDAINKLARHTEYPKSKIV